MSSFERAITSFGPADRSLIKERLQIWSVTTELGRIIAPNINPLEHFLRSAEMMPLLYVLLTWDGVDSTVLEREYQKACYQKTRKGGQVRKIRASCMLGRAVERPVFESFLERRYYHQEHVFGSFDHIRDFVDRLCLGMPLSTREASLMIAEFSVWATWENSASATDPFAFAVDDALKIRSSLGLPKRFSSLQLLLMVYQKPPALSLYRPTIADAELHPHFQPPPKGFRDHGWTRPWPTDLVDLAGDKPLPRPECVHTPIPMDLLTLPLRTGK